MAVTGALVYAGHNHLRYLITAAGGGGGSVTITSTGAASPDLKTDTLVGPLKNLANAFENGYGQIAAGALNQAQARALWLSQDPTNLVSQSGQMPISAICSLTERDPTADMRASVDAGVDGGGHPAIVVSALNNGTAYLDVIGPNQIGA